MHGRHYLPSGRRKRVYSNYSEPVRLISSDGEAPLLEWDGSAALPHELHPIADPESEEHNGSTSDAA